MIKASAAIRLGIIKYPHQTFNIPMNMKGGGCVLTAYYAGCEVEMKSISPEHDPALCIFDRCPLCNQYKSFKPGIFVHMNDYHRISREEIANLAEQRENQLEAVEEAQRIIKEQPSEALRESDSSIAVSSSVFA